MDRAKLQLVGVAAMFVASKYEERHSPHMEKFVYLTAYTYTKKEVLEMEQRILTAVPMQSGTPYSTDFSAWDF